MLFTPTYHVFDLYQGHQGATLLPARVTAPDYALKSVRVPSLSASASSVNGVITVSVVNLDPRRAANLQIHCHRRHSKACTRVAALFLSWRPRNRWWSWNCGRRR